MAVKRHKRNGRVYLAEYKTERIAGKVKSTYVRYLGVEGEPKTLPKKRIPAERKVDFSRTSQTGDVTVLWHIAEELGIPEIIDRSVFGNDILPKITPGKILAIWAINRIIDPESATQLSEWVRYTDLPLLSVISPDSFTKDVFLNSLDFICQNNPSIGKIEDISSSIEEGLYEHWRLRHPLPAGESEILAYDMTAVLFHGNSCPIAQLGYNAEHIKRNQINLAILVSKYDRYPITHSTYPGDRTSITTVNNLFSRLSDLAIDPGTLLWDRGNVSDLSVRTIERLKWNIICGLPKSTKAVQNILLNTEVPSTPLYKVKTSVCGHIYAKKIKAHVFGKMRSITVYTNLNAGIRDTEERNNSLQSLSKKVEIIVTNDENLNEKQLVKLLKTQLKSKYRFFSYTLENINSHITGKWQFNEEEITKAQMADGKYAILSTNMSLSAKDVVGEYFGKDFVEKRFQKMKSAHELTPVRHRLEHRIRGYVFLNMLALRLNTAIFEKFKDICPENTAECVGTFLKKMGRVERTEVQVDGQARTVYLNLTPELQETLKLLHFSHLFEPNLTP